MLSVYIHTLASDPLIDPLDENDLFGASVALVGDLDGNGVVDLIVGAPGATVDGLPVGLSLVGAPGSDEQLLDLACALEE